MYIENEKELRNLPDGTEIAIMIDGLQDYPDYDREVPEFVVGAIKHQFPPDLYAYFIFCTNDKALDNDWVSNSLPDYMYGWLIQYDEYEHICVLDTPEKYNHFCKKFDEIR